jgi:hypothetical protein
LRKSPERPPPSNRGPTIPPTTPRPPPPPPHRTTHAFHPRRSYRSMWAVFTRSNSVRGTLPCSHRVARCSGDVPGLCSNATPSIMTVDLCDCPHSLQKNTREVSPSFSDLRQSSITPTVLRYREWGAQIPGASGPGDYFLYDDT